MRRFRVLLDANVLVDAQLRDLFLTMAELEVIDVRWSRPILDDTRRALVTRLGLDESKVARLIAMLDDRFVGAEVLEFEHLIDQLDLPDADDRHVFAAAMVGECDLLITANIRDFPTSGEDVAVVSPDDGLVLIAELFGADLAAVVDRILARLSRPSMTVGTYLDRLSTRVPRGTTAVLAAIATGGES